MLFESSSLNSLLESPAARTIQGLSFTEVNYNSAIEILQERFRGPQQIFQPTWTDCSNYQAVMRTQRSISLRFVYDKISVLVHGMSSLGIASD